MSSFPFIVKICGITNQEDARSAVEAGANALGFNFYERSPRCITPAGAREIVQATPGDYLKIGVFVNPSEQEIFTIAAQVPLDVLQLHGSHCNIPRSTPCRIWRAIAATEDAPARSDSIEAWLVDAPSAEYGGSGMAFDWSLAARFPHRTIVAGGLDASNVAEAIRVASPWGVDACSRLESSPGKKDPERVRDFVHAALAAVHQEIKL